MKKITITAIPVCRNRISFHFAWCSHVLLVKIMGDKVLGCHKRPMVFAEAWDMARALVAMNIDQLVCGTMPGYFRDWFESKKVRVISFQKGVAQDVFAQFKQKIQHIACEETHQCGVTCFFQNVLNETKTGG